MRNILTFLGLNILVTVLLSLAFGMGDVSTLGIMMFTLLSLVIPIIVKQHPRVAHLFTFPLEDTSYAYSWFGWTVFFFMGNGIIPFSLAGSSKIALLSVWAAGMAISIVVMVLTGMILTLFFKRPRIHPIFDDVLNIAVWTLPIPLLVLGDILFLNLKDPMVQAAVVNTLNSATLNLGIIIAVLALTIVTMLAFVFYYYPKGDVKKFPRLVSILVMAVLWLAINGHLFFGGWLPDWFKDFIIVVLPTFSGSPLVYITPAIIELIILVVAISIGKGIEALWLSKGK